MNQPSGKIIQIGAVVGDVGTGEIVEELSIFVNPKECLSQYIIDLTGINQKDVDLGLPLLSAYEELKKIHSKYQSFINPICWGGGDSLELLNQIKLENPNFKDADWCFGRRWVDVKTVFISYRLGNKNKFQGGLAKSMTKLGLKFQGKKHNAKDDAKNTFLMYCELIKRFKY